MDDLSSENLSQVMETREYITRIALRRLELLADSSRAIDQKAGILMGFVVVVVALGLGGATPNLSSPVDMLFGYTGFGALFAALVVLIACLAPRDIRLDPDVEKLLGKLWSSPLHLAIEGVAASLRSAWEVNSQSHRRKSSLFSCALKLAVVGIALLAVDMLVVRMMV